MTFDCLNSLEMRETRNRSDRGSGGVRDRASQPNAQKLGFYLSVLNFLSLCLFASASLLCDGLCRAAFASAAASGLTSRSTHLTVFRASACSSTDRACAEMLALLMAPSTPHMMPLA